MRYTKKIHLPSHVYLLVGLTLILSAGCSKKTITAGFPSELSLGSRVAHTATTQIGVRYRAGGDSPQRGFDCSGLVYWAYSRHGIKVPRVTTGQAEAGRAVSRSELAPGDIVVFRERSGPNQLHTGIYIGNSSFVHSPNSRSSVRTDSLKATHWQKTFVSGRRVVPA